MFDPNTGTITDPADETVYTGSCLVVPTGGARVVEFGEGPVTVKTYDVVIGGPVTGIEVGDSVAVTSTRDPDLDAMTLTVLEVIKSELIANRRIICEGT